MDMEASEDDDEEDEQITDEQRRAIEEDKNLYRLRQERSALEVLSAEEIARNVQERSHFLKERIEEEEEDSSLKSQGDRLPTVNDPKLFSVRCNPGKEMEIIIGILKKKQFSSHSVPIYSAVCSPHSKGYIYIEAESERHVQIALNEIPDAYPISKIGSTDKNMEVVPINERPQVLTVTEAKRPRAASSKYSARRGEDDEDDEDEDEENFVLGSSGERLHNGDWVRLKRGALTGYRGDLAQIVALDPLKNTVDLKMIPRFDLMEIIAGEYEKIRHSAEKNDPDAAKKLKQAVNDARKAARSYVDRPPQKLFTEDDMQSAVSRFNASLSRDAPMQAKVGDFLTEMGSGRGGYILCKKYRIVEGGFYVRMGVKGGSLDGVNVNPLPDEIQRFQAGVRAVEDGEGDDSLAALARTIPKRENVFVAGDSCRITEGEEVGVAGTVVTVRGDIAVIKPDKNFFLKKSTLEVEVSKLEKFFRPGDHVRVMRGKLTGETGFVLRVKKDESVAGSPSVAIIRSDSTDTNIPVFISDLQISNETFIGETSRGGYFLHDLVQLPNRNLGVIVAINRETFTVLDGSNVVYKLRLQEMGARKTSSRGPNGRGGAGFVESGMDKHRRNLIVGDRVDVVDGQHRGITGTVKHFTHQTAFVESKSITTNGGIVAIDSSYLVLVGADRPAANVPAGYGSGNGRRQKFRSGMRVRITKGQYRGYMALVRNTTSAGVQVEIEANSRRVVVAMDSVESADGSGSRGRMGSGYVGGSMHMDRRDESMRDEVATPSHLLATPMREDFTTPSQATPDWDSYFANTPRGDFAGTPSSETPSAATPMSRPDYTGTPDTYAHEGGQTPFTPAMSMQTPATPGYAAVSTPGYPLGVSTPSASVQTPSSDTPGGPF